MSNVKKIIINISLLNCVLFSQSINKFKSDPIPTHQFTSVNYTRLTEIPSLGLDTRIFSTPLLPLNPDLTNLPNTINLALGPKKTLESALIRNVQPSQVYQARNTVKIPGKKSTVNPKVSRERKPNVNDNPFGIFNLEISSNKSMIRGASLGSAPSGFSFILNTPLGFEFGKNKFTLSIISGSYFYSRKENITSSFTGIGVNINSVILPF